MWDCCDVCGLVAPAQKLLRHTHAPDVALVINNHQASLGIYDGNNYVVLDFNLPEAWVNFLLWCCGVSLAHSGNYSVPQIFREFAWALSRGAEDDIKFLKAKIDGIVKSWRRKKSK